MTLLVLSGAVLRGGSQSCTPEFGVRLSVAGVVDVAVQGVIEGDSSLKATREGSTLANWVRSFSMSGRIDRTANVPFII
jgi:hypothetical protein